MLISFLCLQAKERNTFQYILLSILYPTVYLIKFYTVIICIVHMGGKALCPEFKYKVVRGGAGCCSQLLPAPAPPLLSWLPLSLPPYPLLTTHPLALAGMQIHSSWGHRVCACSSLSSSTNPSPLVTVVVASPAQAGAATAATAVTTLGWGQSNHMLQQGWSPARPREYVMGERAGRCEAEAAWGQKGQAWVASNRGTGMERGRG